MSSELGILKYGGGSNSSVGRAAANFPGAAINPISRCTTPIEHMANDGTKSRVGHATGFFWSRGENVFLITNWHVVSGRNPFTLEVISERGYIPERIAFHGQLAKIENENIRFTRPEWILHFNDGMKDLLSKPPMPHGIVTDIFAIPIEKRIITRNKEFEMPGGRIVNISPIMNDQSFEKIQTMSGDDCFVVGYPLSNYEGLMYPIWRSGSIASETLLGLGEVPAFLVDATATPAMSGSPVLRKCNSFVVQNQDRGFIEQISHYEMIGVYAGRLSSKDLERTNLGYVWYKTLIDDVIDYYGFGNVSPVLVSENTTALDPLSGV